MKKAIVHFIPVRDGEPTASVAEKTARILKAAGFERLLRKGCACAVKTHFGEGNCAGYVKPEVAAEVCRFAKKLGTLPFVTDTNTLYRGRRSNAVDHLLQAEAHGFTTERLGAPVIIADGLYGADQVSVPVKNTKHFPEVRIATALHQAPCCIVLTHVKGHIAVGLGATIKNIGMGCAARAGKLAQHQGGAPVVRKNKCVACGICARWCPTSAIQIKADSSKKKHAVLSPEKCIGCGECLALCPEDAVGFSWGDDGAALCEKIVEHALGFSLTKPRGIGYLNYVMDVTRNCDCVGVKQKPEWPNVGILASTDAVAVDKAAADLCLKEYGQDVWRKWWPESKYEVLFRYGEEVGLGTTRYELVPSE